jgi:hypothetical protein
MPAKNVYHDAVREALLADGWTITHDPLYLAYGSRKLFVDLAADRITIAAERVEERIAVEVQSFLGESLIENLRNCIGQYLMYRLLIEELNENRILYLAVSNEVYDEILSERIGQLVTDRLQIRLMIFDPNTRRIVQWTN